MGKYVSLRYFFEMLIVLFLQRQQESDPQVIAFLHGSSNTEDMMVDQEFDDDISDAMSVDDGDRAMPDIALMKRIARRFLADSEDSLPNSETQLRIYRQGNAQVFMHLCMLLQLDCRDVDINSRSAKHSFFDIFTSSVCDV